MFRTFSPVFGCVLAIACSGGGSGAGNGGESSTAGNGPSGGAAGGGSANGGSTNSAGSNSAGSSNTAGTNGSTVRGGFSVNIQTGNGCALSSQYQDFPIVSNGHPVGATQKSASVADMDGANDGSLASVVCSWFSDVSPYMIGAGITLGPAGNTRQVSMNSRLVMGSSSVGGMSFSGKALPEADGYQAPCNFSIIQLDEASRSVWGSFECDALKNFSQAATGCTVGPSYFFFQNCTKP